MDNSPGTSHLDVPHESEKGDGKLSYRSVGVGDLEDIKIALRGIKTEPFKASDVQQKMENGESIPLRELGRALLFRGYCTQVGVDKTTGGALLIKRRAKGAC